MACSKETTKNNSDIKDCLGVLGGTALLDSCGICNGTSVDYCSCESIFQYEQSTSQAPYFFTEVLINGISIDTTDWVGAFNGDKCVGYQKWSACNGNACEVVTQGYDGSDRTIGYMQSGERPSFKIFDQSENIIYNAISNDIIPVWQNLSISIIPTLKSDSIYIANCQ